jgi:hypothetical protein
MKGFVKDPEATLDYTFDWSPWLGNDTITSSSWAINKSGLTIVPASESFDDTTTTLFLTGGAEGEDYKVTNTITTNASRTDERTVEINVRHR